MGGTFLPPHYNAVNGTAKSPSSTPFEAQGSPLAQTDLRIQSGASFDGNRLTGLKLSKRIVKIRVTTSYLEGRETLRASRIDCCWWSDMGNLLTAILSSTL